MTTGTAVWLYLVAAAVLAAWALVRFPQARPRSMAVALWAFLAGQIIPFLGLQALPLVDSARVALPLVVLPCFFVAWLTTGWLVWAIVGTVGRAEPHG